MRIVADENMPLVTEFFGGFGEVVRLPGRQMRPADLRDAEVLLVRSVTRVDRALLAGSRIRFVGTATIGTDHIDAAALAELGIALASAPGCNAQAVVEYVLTALQMLALRQGWAPSSRTLGVVGLGNVGSRLARLAAAQGYRVLGCDPLVRMPDVAQCSWPELLRRADILSLHVPLVTAGPCPTRHLLGSAELAGLRPGTILVNTSRGAVIDNAALQARLAAAAGLCAVLDVWEGEPAILPGLLEQACIGTPHVAGYSQEGKWRGTEMIHRAFCRFLGVRPVLGLADILPPSPPRELVLDPAPLPTLLAAAMQQACPLQRDDSALRAARREADPAAAFDRLRKQYPERREFAAWHARLPDDHPAAAALRSLGFAVGPGPAPALDAGLS